MATMTGARLGEYRLEGILGRGGMGDVYRARSEARLGSASVAVKVLCAELAADAELVSRFVSEARAASSLRHPHIVEVTEGGSASDPLGQLVYYFVMELLEGETLLARIRRGLVPVDIGLRIMAQCASALAAAHERGIVHRDLKPANVFLVDRVAGANGVAAKLLDFGVARLLDPTLHPTAAHHTRTGIMIGTPAYMSPEQTTGRGIVDARSDVYSLGVLAYQVLSGRRPFEQTALVELVRAQRSLRPLPPSTHRPEISAGLDAAVLRALEKSPADRYPSMAEFEAALTDCARALDSSAGIEADAPSTKRSGLDTSARPDLPTAVAAPRPRERNSLGTEPTAIIVPPRGRNR
jgi:serine/threonine-protein kinase